MRFGFRSSKIRGLPLVTTWSFCVTTTEPLARACGSTAAAGVRAPAGLHWRDFDPWSERALPWRRRTGIVNNDSDFSKSSMCACTTFHIAGEGRFLFLCRAFRATPLRSEWLIAGFCEKLALAFGYARHGALRTRVSAGRSARAQNATAHTPRRGNCIMKYFVLADLPETDRVFAAGRRLWLRRRGVFHESGSSPHYPRSAPPRAIDDRSLSAVSRFIEQFDVDMLVRCHDPLLIST